MKFMKQKKATAEPQNDDINQVSNMQCHEVIHQQFNDAVDQVSNMQCNEGIREQFNNAINQMTAFVGTVLPKKDSTYALTRGASKTSEKMMTTQARDDNEVPSNKEEDARSDERYTEESDGTYDWDDIVGQITADPSLAKIDVDGILPLHAACGAGAPIHVIKMLLEIYPEAAQAKCGKGYLPLFYHLALITESPSEDIVAALLESYPGAAAVVDPNKQHPIHLACKATGVSEEIFTMLLRAHPDGACVCDVYGKYPVDYANANKDAATRKVALASLLSNDPEEFRRRYVVDVKEIVKKEQPLDETEETLKPAHDVAVPVARSRSNASTMSQASKKSTKSVQDVEVPVARSRSNASTKSHASKKSSESVQDVEVPVARSRSNASTKSQISSKSSKSVHDIILAVSRSRSNAMSQSSKKSIKSVQDVEVPVARSRSNASTKSQASNKSSKSVDGVEVPVARSRSNASTKSQASNKSSKTAQDVEFPVARSSSSGSAIQQVVEAALTAEESNIDIICKFPTSSEADVVANEKVAKVEVKPEEKFAEVAEDEVEPEEKFAEVAEVEVEPACMVTRHSKMPQNCQSITKVCHLLRWRPFMMMIGNQCVQESLKTKGVGSFLQRSKKTPPKKVMKDVFQSTGDGEADKTSMQAKLQETISMTKYQLKEAEKELKTLKKRRREAKEMAGRSPFNVHLKKKFKALNKKATLAAKEVLAYEKALESQLEQLEKLCATGKEEDGDDEYGIDLSDISDDWTVA